MTCIEEERVSSIGDTSFLRTELQGPLWFFIMQISSRQKDSFSEQTCFCTVGGPPNDNGEGIPEPSGGQGIETTSLLQYRQLPSPSEIPPLTVVESSGDGFKASTQITSFQPSYQGPKGKSQFGM